MTLHLTPEITPVSELSEPEIDDLLALFRRYYEVAEPASFRHDLLEKDLLIRLYDLDRTLHGFSTVSGYATRPAGPPLGVIYSGDTIIEPECWGTSALPRGWLEAVARLAQTCPRPLYWLLVSSGYKTYRFLSVFFRDFYPAFDRATPPHVQALVDELAEERFGDQLDRKRGIVRFRRGATPLRHGIAEVEGRRLADPHVAFFLERNPGHSEGDELVCLAEIALDNLTPAGRRIVDAAGFSLGP